MRGRIVGDVLIVLVLPLVVLAASVLAILLITSVTW